MFDTAGSLDTGQQFSKPPCSSMAPQGPSATATAAPTSEQDRGQTISSTSGQSGPKVSQAEVPSVPPPGQETGHAAGVEWQGTSDEYSHGESPCVEPSEHDVSSSLSSSRQRDSVVLPQMQHADLQNVLQVRDPVFDRLMASSTLTKPHLGPHTCFVTKAIVSCWCHVAFKTVCLL